MPSVFLDDYGLFVRSKGAGSDVLFLHGFALDHRMWSEQLAALSARHRCVTPDLPGFGRSPLGSTGRLDLDGQARRLASLLTSRTDVVGHSFGGHVALRLADQHPELVGSIALVGVTLLRDSPAPAGRSPVIVADGIASYADRVVPQLHPSDGSLFLRARLRTMAESVAYETLYAPLDRDKRTERAVLDRLDLPVLVVGAADDRAATPVAIRSLAAAIRGALVVEIAGAGHMVPLEQPAALSAALERFWSAVS